MLPRSRRRNRAVQPSSFLYLRKTDCVGSAQELLERRGVLMDRHGQELRIEADAGAFRFEQKVFPVHDRVLPGLRRPGVQVCSLGQITNALFEVGGQYRRSM